MALGAFLPPVVAELISEVGKFTAGFGAAKAELTGFEAATTRLAAVGKVAMTGLALGAAAAGIASVKLGMDFDQTMELVHTQAGAAQSEVDALKNKVLDLAPTVGIGPDKLAEGLYHIESTGFRGKAALDILAASARLAAMGLADLDTVTFAMSGTMSVHLKDIRDAADATNYLNQIVGMGDMRMQQLTAAIGTGVLPAFASAGLGMKDFGAALATLTDNSVPADEAATRLRMTVALMSAPTHVATVALNSIGLSATQLATDMRGPGGLLAAVEDLKTHLDKSGLSAVEQAQVIEHAFGGGRTSSAIQTLLLETDRLRDKYHQLGDAGSRAAKADEAWAQQQRQFKQQLHEVSAELQVVGIKVGEFLIPYVQSSAAWLAKHTEVVKIAALVIGGVLVAAMVAFTASVVANTVAMLANPVTWIILAIIAAVALLAVGIYELVKHWGTVWGFVKRIALDVWHWLVDAWHVTWRTIMAVVGWIKTNIIDPIVHAFDVGLVQPISFLLSFVMDIWRFVWGFLSVVFADWMRHTEATWHRIEPIVHRVQGWLLDFAHWVERVFVHPVVVLFHWLMDQTDAAWHRTLDALNRVKGWFLEFWHWLDREIIQPIVHAFDKIASAIGGLLHGLKDLSSKIGGSGASVAHFFGFSAADGGWVPGPPGAPMLAKVHGGEFVLSRDMLAGITRGPSVSGMTPQPAMAAAAGAAPIVIHNKVTLDGRVVYDTTVTHAQREKARTGSTGLA